MVYVHTLSNHSTKSVSFNPLCFILMDEIVSQISTVSYSSSKFRMNHIHIFMYFCSYIICHAKNECYTIENTKEQEIAANYEKYIRARDPFRWRSIHQILNSLGNSFCSDSNLAGASLCRYNYCTWQVWHETHICCQGMRKICSDDQKMKCDKMKF